VDARKVESLFAQTLVGDYEGEDGWKAVTALRQDGSREIFSYAAAWCSSDDPLKRARAAAVLCQLRRAPTTSELAERPEWVFRGETYLLVTRMLENEQDPLVLDSAISALGHLDNVEAVPLILRYTGHPDEGVAFRWRSRSAVFQTTTMPLKAYLFSPWILTRMSVIGQSLASGCKEMSTRLRFVKLSFDHWRTLMLTSARKPPSAWENVETNVSFRYSGNAQ